MIELLGKIPRHYALSGKYSQEYFTKRGTPPLCLWPALRTVDGRWRRKVPVSTFRSTKVVCVCVCRPAGKIMNTDQWMYFEQCHQTLIQVSVVLPKPAWQRYIQCLLSCSQETWLDTWYCIDSHDFSPPQGSKEREVGRSSGVIFNSFLKMRST